MDNKTLKAFFKIIALVLVLGTMALMPLKVRDLHYQSLLAERDEQLINNGLPLTEEDFIKWNEPPSNGFKYISDLQDALDKFENDFLVANKEDTTDYMPVIGDDYLGSKYAKYTSDRQKRVAFMESHKDLYLKWFDREAAPIYSLVDKILVEKYIYQKEKIFADLIYMTPIRGASLLLAQASYNSLYLHDNPEQALQVVDKICDLSVALKCNKTMLDMIISVGIGLTAIEPLQDVLLYEKTSKLSPELLRQMASKLDTIRDNLNPMAENAFLGELIYARQLYDKIVANDDTENLSDSFYPEPVLLDNLFTLQFYIFFILHEDFYCLSSALLDYRELVKKDGVSVVNVILGPKEQESEYIVMAKEIIFPFSDDTVYTREGFILQKLRVQNKLSIAAIACRIRANKIEGKPYPEDLSAFAADPLTGKPYLLQKEIDKILIYSDSPVMNNENRDITVKSSPEDFAISLPIIK